MPQNRFDIVYSQDNTLHTENCPLLYVGGRLLFDKIKNQKLLQLKFQNIKNAIINSATISIELYGNDKKLLDTLSHTYESIEIKRDNDFGEQIPIYLQESEAALFIVQINSVNFYDINKDSNDVWENNINITYEITQDEIIDEFDPELIKIFREEKEVYSFDKYVFKEYSDMWSCTCGALNFNDEEQCHFCEKNKRWIEEHQNKEYLISKIQEKERLKEEELKKEQERLENRPEIVKKLDSFFTKIKNHKWTKLDFVKIGCCVAVFILVYYILNLSFGFGNRRFNIVKFNGNKINILEDKQDFLEKTFGSRIKFDRYENLITSVNDPSFDNSIYTSFKISNDSGDNLIEGCMEYGEIAIICTENPSINVGGIHVGDSEEKAFKLLKSDETHSISNKCIFLLGEKNELLSTIDMHVPEDYEDVTGDVWESYVDDGFFEYDEDDDTLTLYGAKLYYPEEFKKASYAIQLIINDNDDTIDSITIINISNLLS